MPTLADLRSAVTPVVIQRGQIKFTLQCALEKFSLEGDFESDAHNAPIEGVNYDRLRSESIDAQNAMDMLKIEHQEALESIPLLSDLDALRTELESEKRAARNPKKTSGKIVISDDELKTAFEARLTACNVRCEEILSRLQKADAEMRRALARRVAFLVVSSDITAPDGQDCLSGKVHKTPEEFEADTKFFFAIFQEGMLRRLLTLIERAVFDPLS